LEQTLLGQVSYEPKRPLVPLIDIIWECDSNSRRHEIENKKGVVEELRGVSRISGTEKPHSQQFFWDNHVIFRVESELGLVRSLLLLAKRLAKPPNNFTWLIFFGQQRKINISAFTMSTPFRQGLSKCVHST
jgi:hypothetical protein